MYNRYNSENTRSYANSNCVEIKIIISYKNVDKITIKKMEKLSTSKSHKNEQPIVD